MLKVANGRRDLAALVEYRGRGEQARGLAPGIPRGAADLDSLFRHLQSLVVLSAGEIEVRRGLEVVGKHWHVAQVPPQLAGLLQGRPGVRFTAGGEVDPSGSTFLY